MSPEESKDKLKSMINSLIKDQPDEANKDLHDVLASKMRDRVNPPAAAEEESSEPAAEEPAEDEEVDLEATPPEEPAE